MLCALQSVKLPSTLQILGDSAFCDCENLENINFPEQLQVIGTRCFRGTKLQKIYFPESIRTIKCGAFYGCKALTDVSFSMSSHGCEVQEHVFGNSGLNENSVVFPQNYNVSWDVFNASSWL